MSGDKSIASVPGLSNNTPEFIAALWDMAAKNGWNPDHIAAVMSSESRVTASARNPLPGKASGLIQFLDSTAKGLGIAGGADAVIKMTAVEQLPFVEKYYQRAFGSRVRSPRMVDFYLAGWGDGIGAPLSFILADKNAPLTFSGGTHNKYTLNAGLDVNHDGLITVGDLQARLENILASAKGKRIPVPDAAVITRTGLSGGTATLPLSSGFLSSEWGQESSGELSESEVLEHAENYLQGTPNGKAPINS